MQIETLIIGAGQAGLATGYHLQRRGRPFLIIDGNGRLGDNWRRQWDTLRLNTPVNTRLPGLAFPSGAMVVSQARAAAISVWNLQYDYHRAHKRRGPPFHQHAS